MRRRHFIALAGIAPLAGCGIFRRDRSTGVATGEAATDPRPLVQQVTRLEVDPLPFGAIVRATGLPPRQGYYEGELVRVPSTDRGILAFQLRAYAPHYQTQVVNARSREIVVATFVPADRLEGVREVRVSGQVNALYARR